MTRQIAIIPMDNRAYSTSDPGILTAIAGWTAVNPPAAAVGDDLRTEADTAALTEWLETVAGESGCIIVPLDLFLYGGCISGMYKTVDSQDVSKVLKIFTGIKARNPECCLYAFKNLQGISSLDFIRKGISAETAQDLYTYFELCGKCESGCQENDKKQLDALRAGIPAEILAEYQHIRKQQLEVNVQLVKAAAEDVFDYLLFTQADVPAAGLQLQEQKTLIEAMAGYYDKTGIITGLDEATLLLTARFLNLRHALLPKYFLQYSSAAGPTLRCCCEDRLLDDNIRNHIAVSGGVSVSCPDEADCILMIHTPEERHQDLWLGTRQHSIPNRNLWSFASSIQHYFNNARKVALIDAAFLNGGDNLLISFLASSLDLRDLSGYAGWNTAANSTGTVLAQVCAQAAGRANGVAAEFIEHEKERFLLTRFINDWLYQGKVRRKITDWIKRELKIEPWELGECREQVESRIKKEMLPEIKAFADKFFPGWNYEKIEVRLPRPRASTLNVIIGE